MINIFKYLNGPSPFVCSRVTPFYFYQLIFKWEKTCIYILSNIFDLRPVCRTIRVPLVTAFSVHFAPNVPALLYHLNSLFFMHWVFFFIFQILSVLSYMPGLFYLQMICPYTIAAVDNKNVPSTPNFSREKLLVSRSFIVFMIFEIGG